MKKIILCLVLLSLNLKAENDFPVNLKVGDKKEKPEALTIKEYPELKKFLFVPPKSKFSFGIGAAPLGLIGSKFAFTLNLFQLHYNTDRFDIEVFSASIGKAFSNSEFADNTLFTLRSSPKINLINIFDNGVLSIGPLIGIELVRFDEVQAKTEKPVSPGSAQTFKTENSIDLTSVGIMYGAILSQTFELSSGNKFKISEVFYKQTYDISKTRFDWTYDFDEDRLDEGSSERADLIADMEAATVFAIEFSYIF